MRSLNIWTYFLSNLLILCVNGQGIQTNSITGQITNLSDAKSQKIIEEVRFYEPEGNVRIPYSRIKGSPFWRDEFLQARIYTTYGKIYSAPIRLNLVTNEIHFLKDGEERVLVELSIDKIIFELDKDSVLFLANNSNMAVTNKNENGYMQVLNPGKYELLKQVRRTVDSADSLFRTQKRYFFVDEVNYFLRSGDRVEKIKRLNKDNIFKLLPSASNYAGWIDENKIDLKKEEDVIGFLTHYNATHTTKEN